jgi:hypothetical protein
MKIVTAVVNNPGFIEIQYHTLKKYFKGTDEADYEFIVFNDAKAFPDFTNDGDITIRTQIEDVCRSLGIQCIPIENDQHRTVTKSAIRCADSMNAILRYQLAQPPDKYLLLDSDMFLIDYLDINKYSAYACAVVLQQRTNLNYIWNGIYYFDFNKLKNVNLLNWNEGYGGDVGGMMRDWFKELTAGQDVPNTDDVRWADKQKTFHNESSGIYYMRHLWSCSWNEQELPVRYRGRHDLIKFLKEDVRNAGGNFYCEIYDDIFLHYRAGGNWNEEGMTLHNQMTNKLRKALLPDNL